jgi:NADH:ubiquinone oxidoreductase subunit C
MERAESNFYRLKSLRTNHYMHIEGKLEYVEMGSVMPAWHSAQWVIERVL